MRQEAGQGMNFLEAIFSFVFGDGNPNESYEDRRWRLVSVALVAAILPAAVPLAAILPAAVPLAVLLPVHAVLQQTPSVT